MLLLPAMAALYRLLDAPTGRGAVVVGLWTAALYLFQIVPWAAFGGYAILLLVVELGCRRWRGPLYAAAAMAPSLAMLAIGLSQARRIGYLGEGRYEALADSPVKLMSRAANMINWFQSETTDEWVLLAVMLILVLLVVSDGGPRTSADAAADPWRRRVRVPLAFVAFLAMAFATPFWIKKPFNWWMINQRFLLFAACVAVFFPRGPIRGARLGLVGAAVVAMCFLPREMTKAISRLLQARLAAHRPHPPDAARLATAAAARARALLRGPVLAPQMTIWRELYNYPLVYRGGYDPYLYDDGFPIRRIGSLPRRRCRAPPRRSSRPRRRASTPPP